MLSGQFFSWRISSSGGPARRGPTAGRASGDGGVVRGVRQCSRRPSRACSPAPAAARLLAGCAPAGCSRAGRPGPRQRRPCRAPASTPHSAGRRGSPALRNPPGERPAQGRGTRTVWTWARGHARGKLPDGVVKGTGRAGGAHAQRCNAPEAALGAQAINWGKALGQSFGTLSAWPFAK